MKKICDIYIFLIICILTIFIPGCVLLRPPDVITSAVTFIGPTSATGGGKVTDDGNSVMIVRGVCWSTTKSPDLEDQRTTDGYYYGCNFAFSPEIRNFECVNSGYCDIRRHQGSRQVRIPQMIEQYKGKIDVTIAKKIISDHYDVYLKKINPCSRTICSHYELDAREYMSDPGRPKPYTPKGAIDGMVADADMIRNMSFLAKYGSSCNISFNASEFCRKHSQWGHLEPYLLNRPYQPWTIFSTYTKPPIKMQVPKIKTKTKRRSRERLHTASRKSD